MPISSLAHQQADLVGRWERSVASITVLGQLGSRFLGPRQPVAEYF